MQPVSYSLTFPVMDFNVIKTRYHVSGDICLHGMCRLVFQLCLTSESKMLLVADLKQQLPQ